MCLCQSTPWFQGCAALQGTMTRRRTAITTITILPRFHSASTKTSRRPFWQGRPGNGDGEGRRVHRQHLGKWGPLASSSSSSSSPRRTTGSSLPIYYRRSKQRLHNMDSLPRKPLVWIDCEMTGLRPDHDVILEIYCIITDGRDLRPVDDGWGTIVHCPQERLAQMDEWCTDHHGASGLTAACIASTVTPEAAAEQLLAYVQRWCPEPREALLAGNSVHADAAFLRRAPYDKVLEHLHYRILDVSSLKEAAFRWAPTGALRKTPAKTEAHRAKQDILESIAEAQYYKQRFFEK